MSGHRGKVAYDAALRDNQVFPGLLWQDRGYELLFRLCEVVENNPELLTEARAAGKAQASSSGEPKVRLTAHVYAELAQKLLDQVPGFDKLFLNYNEAARWTYGARMSSKLAILKKGIFPIPRTPNDSAALLLPKLKNLVSHLFHGMTNSRTHLSRLIRSQDNKRLNWMIKEAAARLQSLWHMVFLNPW